MTNIDENVLLAALGKQLMTESLSDVELMHATEATPNYRILPWVNVVKIGGQSIMDRGREAVYPLVEEILANLKTHKMILGTGAGTRARHIYSLAIDLGLPTGVLTVLGTAVAGRMPTCFTFCWRDTGFRSLNRKASVPYRTTSWSGTP